MLYLFVLFIAVTHAVNLSIYFFNIALSQSDELFISIVGARFPPNNIIINSKNNV